MSVLELLREVALNEDQPYFFTPVPTRAFAIPTPPKLCLKKPPTRVPYELQKKHENARQTLLRFFKKTMRKLVKVCRSTAPEKPSAIHACKVFRSLYPHASTEDFEQMTALLQQLQQTEVFHSNVKAKGFKSCCNAYVEWLFGSPGVKNLYNFHTSLTAAAGVLERVLRLPHDVTEAQRSTILDFAYNIPGNLP